MLQAGSHAAHPQSGLSVQLREAAPGVFDDVTRPWLSGVKNPCYKDQQGAVRCLPYLSIIGVSKSGTTDLYKKLMLLKCASLLPAVFACVHDLDPTTLTSH